MGGPDAVEVEIARLVTLDRKALRIRWRAMMGRAAPEHIGRSLLVRILAYRLQAERFGDLDPGTARFLDRLVNAPEAGMVPLPDEERVRRGTMLTREWQGRLHRVIAVERGFAWNEQTYDSLSAVARAITGTSWNGPRFFGLRSKAPASGLKDDGTRSVVP